MQKSVLMVAPETSAHLICELPRLFKNAGFRVTVLAFPDWSLQYSSYIDELIDTSASPKEVIEHAALLVAQRTFQLKILSSDALIRAEILFSKIDKLTGYVFRIEPYSCKGGIRIDSEY